MGVKSPTGSISEVTTVKVPRATAMTASHPRTGERFGAGEEGGVRLEAPALGVCVMVASQGRCEFTNNSESLILR
jgi:hypothetical protein